MLCSSVVICPGCGWRGSVSDLSSGACPVHACSYENNQAPHFRLLTVGETLLAETGAPNWKDVDLPAYCQALLAVLGVSNAELMRPYSEPKPIDALHVGDRVRIISGGYHVGNEGEVISFAPPWTLVLLSDGKTVWNAAENEIEKVVDERD